jgi:hypothetical protein
MKILEMIHLRSAACPLKSLGEQVAESIRAKGEETEVVTLYRREGLETDLAIHIRHSEGSAAEGQSALGLRLASELKAHGLVAHTVWQEL